MNRDSEPCDDGASFITPEPPDVCFWKIRGEVTSDDMRRLYAVQAQFADGKSYILALVDLSEISIVSAEARKTAASGGQDVPLRGIAVFGASFHFRVIATAVATAGNLLRHKIDNPIRFFATEAKARAWLADRRARLWKEAQQ